MAVIKKAEKKKKTTTVTKEMGRWNNHKFVVSANLIKSFNGLTIKASSEMNSKEDSNQGFVSRKGGNPTEVDMTIILNAFTGCDVRGESLKFVQEAREGHIDYLYIGTKKIAWYKFMLTNATVKDIVIAHNGRWVSCKVDLTLKQADGKTGSSSSGSSSGGGSGGSGGGGYSSGYSGGGGSGGAYKQSVYNTSPTTTTTPTKKSLVAATHTKAPSTLNSLKVKYGVSSGITSSVKSIADYANQGRKATGQRTGFNVVVIGSKFNKMTQ